MENLMEFNAIFECSHILKIHTKPQDMLGLTELL